MPNLKAIQLIVNFSFLLPTICFTRIIKHPNNKPFLAFLEEILLGYSKYLLTNSLDIYFFVLI